MYKPSFVVEEIQLHMLVGTNALCHV